MKNILLKYSVSIFAIGILFSPFYVLAQSTMVCSSKGYTVLTINGMFTNENSAIKNKDNLKRLLSPILNNESLTVDFLYNPSHLAGLVDIVDVLEQAVIDKKSDYDFINMLNDASQKVKTQKVLLVGHSQGNFYANNLYNKVASKPGGVPYQSIGVYAVATPASYVAGKGRYLTSDTDSIIASILVKIAIFNLPPNTHIPLQASDGNGHSFSDVYLKYRGNRIVSDIKYTLNKLKANDEQEPKEPCISPPEYDLDAVHEATRIIYAIADPTANVVKNTAIYAYNTGAYITNTAHNTGLAISKMFKGLVANAIGSLPDTNSKSIDTFAEAIPPQISAEELPPRKSSQKKVSKIINKKITKKIKTTKITNEIKIDKKITPSKTTLVTNKEKNPKTDVSKSTVPVVSIPTVPIPPPIILGGGGGGNGGRSNNNGGGNSSTITDATPPIISITGTNPIDIVKGITYTDLGATATDETDGTIMVVTTGSVDTTTIGNYIITYTATDSSNNISTAMRTVNVIADTTAPSITSYTFNGTAENITINPLKTPMTLFFKSSENVNWMSIKIEWENDASFYKIFKSDTKDCIDWTDSCSKIWDGILSKGGLLKDGVYKVKIHIQDSVLNDFYDYLYHDNEHILPYKITVDTSL